MTVARLATAAVAAFLLAWTCLAGDGGHPAFAHANLESSTPAANSVVPNPPAAVALKFTESVEESLTQVRVFDVSGSQVDDGQLRVSRSDRTIASIGLRPLENGTYTVSWRNVSAVDGHPALGTFIFSVGFPTLATPPKAEQPPVLSSRAEPWARWGAIVGVLGLLGGLVLRLVFDQTDARQGGLAGNDPASDMAAARRRSDRAIWAMLAIAIAGAVTHAAVSAATTYQIGLGTVVSGDIFSLVQDTFSGRVLAARVALLLATAVPIAYAARLSRAPSGVVSPLRNAAAWSPAIFLAASAVATLSVVSHGAATRDIGRLAFVTDLLHSLASAIWIGGLIQLAFLLPVLMRSRSETIRTGFLRALVPNFSLLAGLSAGVLLLTGIFAAYAQVTAIAASTTPYGLALIAKAALIIPLVGLAALNLLWVRPRLVTDGRARRFFVRFVWAEATLGVLVLLAAAFMTAMEPARQTRFRQLASAPGIEFEDRADGARVLASLQPGTVGDNSIVVHLIDRAGRPIDNASSLSARMRYLGQDLGEPLAAGLDHGDGIWVIHSVPVSIAGPWQLEVLIQRPDAFDANLAWRMEIGTSAATLGALTPEPATARKLFGVQIALIGLLLAGVAVLVGGWGAMKGRALSAAGVVAVITGALFIVRSGAPGDDTLPVSDPVPANQASIDAGRALYAANCQSCHGESGTGDGPSRAGLPTAPADLTTHVPLHGDRELFRFIRDGLITMPAWGDQLSDEEIWHLVNYIRTLSTPVDR